MTAFRIVLVALAVTAVIVSAQAQAPIQISPPAQTKARPAQAPKPQRP